MNIVLDFTLEIEGFNNRVNEIKIKEYVEQILKEELSSKRDIYLSLALVGNEEIQQINREYRGKDLPTDVISFAYHETDEYMVGPYDTLGDIIISLERVEEQSKEYNHSFEREFYYVLTHGVLHLLGYDHMEEVEKKIMRGKEEQILEKFGYTRE